ncbi:MAG: hypothetical protein KF703_09690 [Actinobacteria bacterium]|nr:hypothetical protein [Actinomycetota bacterium]
MTDAETETETDAAAETGSVTETGTEERSLDRFAPWVFGGFLVVAAPLILFHYGAYHWFLRDDFIFLSDRNGRWPDFITPNGGAHPSGVPRTVYIAIWQLFGMRSYVPYQVAVLAVHLASAVLLRLVMVRSGVNTWLASAAAAVLVLFGPGAQNIVWAFQVGFVGSLAYGLAHLLLADHDGPFGRSDVLGIAFGMAGLMSSGVGVTMTFAVGLAVLIRRGWKLALVHVAPLAVLYLAWSAVANPSTSTIFGRPEPDVLLLWIRSSVVGTFLAIGHFQLVAALLALILVVGLALAWGPWRTRSWAEVRRQMSMPVALFAGGIAFSASSGLGRWYLGSEGARSSRYIYLGAALTLPILAVAAQAVATRWRPLGPAMVAVFLVAIPFNLAAFEPEVFGKGYMDQRRFILTTAVRMPFAYDVPASLQPVPDPYAGDKVNMGFLLTALRNGDLEPSTVELTPKVVNEFRVRLGIYQHAADAFPRSCQTVDRLEVSPAKGTTWFLPGKAQIATRDGDRQTGPLVPFDSAAAGNLLTVVLPDLDLVVLPPPGAAELKLCTP